MTTTYDPHHPQYVDEADVRDELTRGYDVCVRCRRCVDLCTSFPTLFELVDRFDDLDAGRLTPAEQDRVVEACFQCKLCAIDCPYVPERHAAALDFPRLLLRAEAMRHANGHLPVRARITSQVLGRTDALGRLAGLAVPVVNRVTGARRGSVIRRTIAATVGVSSVRMLPPYTKQRLSTWMKRRTQGVAPNRQGRVTVYPTCRVEFQDVQVGKDLVAVYERNGIECTLTGARCCGAPWLHSGDVQQFTDVATANVRILAAELRAGGGDIVVPEPTCGHVLKRDYRDYCEADHRADAELVAERTYDAAEYLLRVHSADATELDTLFPGDVPEHITYHVACHLRAQDNGSTSRDLMALTGAEVSLVEQCSGTAGTWGWRAGHEEIAIAMAERLAERIERTGGGRPRTVVAGDCSLANLAIAEQTGATPSHPLSVVARAYGIPIG